MAIVLTANFGNAATSGAPTSIATPSGSPTGAADFIVGWCATSGGQAQLSNITDSVNGAIPSNQILFFGNTGGTFNASVFFFYSLANSVSARTITANFTVGCHAVIIAATFAGLGFNPLDRIGPATNTGTGTTISTGSTATTRFTNNGLALACFVADGGVSGTFSGPGGITVGANSGFSGLGNNGTAANQPAFDAGYYIPTVNGAASGSLTFSQSGAWLGAIVTMSDLSATPPLYHRRNVLYMA